MAPAPPTHQTGAWGCYSDVELMSFAVMYGGRSAVFKERPLRQACPCVQWTMIEGVEGVTSPGHWGQH